MGIYYSYKKLESIIPLLIFDSILEYLSELFYSYRIYLFLLLLGFYNCTIRTLYFIIYIINFFIYFIFLLYF